jgi:hypothetical protein
MTYSTVSTSLLAVAAAATLAACTTTGGSPQWAPSTTAGAMPQDSPAGQPVRPPYRAPSRWSSMNAQPNRSRSWMSPDAKRHALLYASDATAHVYVYTYPGGKLVGTINPGVVPYGECSDRAGNVWITGFNFQTYEATIQLYAHGGTTPIATLSDPGEGAWSCAVDPESGDLVVANLESVPTVGPGGISIYAKAKGNPKVYTDPDPTANDMFVAYDGKDRLYVEGLDYTTPFRLEAFAHKTFTPLSLNGATINYPGGIGFDRGLWIGDGGNGSPSSTNIYQITVSGTTATVTGTTPLTNAGYCGQDLTHGRVALCPSGEYNMALFYKYPAGGTPYKSIGPGCCVFLAISR